MGAYDYGLYRKDMHGRKDARLGTAITAIKQELIYNGYDKNINFDLAYFGDAVTQRLKEFQKDHGLKVDGQAGQSTLTELFRKRVIAMEKKYDLPVGSLGKKIKLESGYDPIAVGIVDPQDTGMAQINIGIHQSVSKEEAFDPAFALDWAAKYDRGNFDIIADRIDVMKAARAAYNIGNTYAQRWLLPVFPASGGPLLNGQDGYERPTKYLALIDRQLW